MLIKGPHLLWYEIIDVDQRSSTSIWNYLCRSKVLLYFVLKLLMLIKGPFLLQFEIIDVNQRSSSTSIWNEMMI